MSLIESVARAGSVGDPGGRGQWGSALGTVNIMNVPVHQQTHREESPPARSRPANDFEVVSENARSDNSGVRSMPPGLLAEPGAESLPGSTPDGIESPPASSRIPSTTELAGTSKEIDGTEVRLRAIRADHEVFERYGPLVRRIALRTVRSLPRTLTVDDIVSAGWVGMSEAMRRRPEDMPEEQFEAYASYRIRGAILDYLRALDPLSRKLRNAARKIALATRNLTQRLGRGPTEEEIATEMGVSLEQYQRTVSDIQDAGFDRVEGVGPMEPQAKDPSPETLATKSELVGNVATAVEGLPERLQIVLGLHYQQECSLREIGEILGVTESRVCQLHAEALQRIRARLEGRAPRLGRRRRRMLD